MNYIEYMQQPAGPITPALQLFNIPNQSVSEEVRQCLGMNSLADNNMSDFFNLKIDDLQQFLDWGNKHALTLAIPIAAGSVLMSNKNENR